MLLLRKTFVVRSLRLAAAEPRHEAEFLFWARVRRFTFRANSIKYVVNEGPLGTAAETWQL